MKVFRAVKGKKTKYALSKQKAKANEFWQNEFIKSARAIRSMGEAKRRKEKGLTPKNPKKSKITSKSPGFLSKYPRLPLYFGVLFAIYLIFDWIKLNSAG